MGAEAKHSYRFVYLKSEKWQNVRLEALAREKGRCQICSEESISNDAHHMWYPESIWDTAAEHLVILCRECHEFIHTMVPDCKTSNELIGRAHWLKFSNAISLWRFKKALLFQPPSESFGVKELRKGIEKHREMLMAAERDRKDVLLGMVDVLPKKIRKAQSRAFLELQRDFSIISAKLAQLARDEQQDL